MTTRELKGIKENLSWAAYHLENPSFHTVYMDGELQVWQLRLLVEKYIEHRTSLMRMRNTLKMARKDRRIIKNMKTFYELLIPH